MFGSLFKAAMAVVTVPVAVVADVVTLGGTLTDNHTKSTYTGDALGQFMKNLENTTK